MLIFLFHSDGEKYSFLSAFSMILKILVVKKRSKITNFNLEFDKLWLHGYLHLLGYDHKKNKDFIKMQKVEIKILKYFHKIN